jgi:hypothetical protein
MALHVNEEELYVHISKSHGQTLGSYLICKFEIYWLYSSPSSSDTWADRDLNQFVENEILGIPKVLGIVCVKTL